MTPAIVDAVASLSAEGHDTLTVSSLLLNGAAALLLEQHTEEEFGELARQMWRTAARQLELLDLLDRVTRRKTLGVRPKRAAAALVRKDTPSLTSVQEQTS